MTSIRHKIVFSGIQPSGAIHIGNYLAAIKQWVTLQDDNNAFYCVVDEHAITVPYAPADLSSHVLEVAAIYLAAGLDPKASVIFVQSHVPAHTKLAWLLATQTSLGELRRMTQYKEKSGQHKNSVNLSLLAYPVLQAADILLYQTDLVPVGEDQVQHIELTRDIAKRFNNKFGDTFKIPKALLNQGAARIMSLSDPTKKMSKSDQPRSYIALTDSPAEIRQKIAAAVTETKPIISFQESGPGARNLLNIFRAFSGREEKAIEMELDGLGFKELKERTAQAVIAAVTPVREKYNDIRADEDYLRQVLSQGAEKAARAANETIQIAQQKMGLL